MQKNHLLLHKLLEKNVQQARSRKNLRSFGPRMVLNEKQDKKTNLHVGFSPIQGIIFSLGPKK